MSTDSRRVAGPRPDLPSFRIPEHAHTHPRNGGVIDASALGGSGGAGGTGGSGSPPFPATTVTGPDAFGDPAAVGSSADYARADHDHGLPAAPDPRHEVLMASGVTPPDPLVSSDGYDWLYSS